jgi:tetratricopeptide (TPR) repeat protein
MTNAIVSGRSRRALLIDGQSLRSFELDDSVVVVSRTRLDLPFLFGDASDLRTLGNATAETVERKLQEDSDFTLALDLVLISLDQELSKDLRQEALEGLADLFVEKAILDRIENVLYSKPLPEDSDLPGALLLVSSEPTSAIVQFLGRLRDYQLLIARVEQAWEAIPQETFGSEDNRKIFREAALEQGLARALVTLEASASTSTFLLKAGLNPSIKGLPNHRQVLQAWIAPFRRLREMPTLLSDQEEKEDFSEEQRFARRGRIDRRAVLREAVKRKSVIIEAMRRRDLARVHDLVDELVAYQQTNSESRHTAKSLCDLAMEAKDLGMTSLQLSLTERSVNIAPGDGWSWAQYADALLGMQRLTEALKAYGQALAFDAGVVAKSGRAEVLKAQGRFADALAAFDEVISLHPDNVVAKNGRAEVLKAQGRFADALAAFDEVISRHPDNVVAKSGRAEVLKAQGRFADALAAFDEVISRHPDNVVAKNGRAEVLKAQGRFADALAAFDEVINLHPDNVVAKSGRAEVLKAQGRFADALAAFDEVISRHPDNVVAKSGRAEVLKAQGRFADALAAFDEVINLHPDDVVAKNGRAEVLKAQGRFADALAAFDEVISRHPDNVVAKSGRAEVLKAQGRFADALAAFDEVINLHPDDVVAKNGRAEVLKAQGRFADALAAFDEVISRHPDNVVAKSGRAEVLKAQGRFADALAAFDEVINLHPDDVVAKNGRAEVLKAQGRFADALAAFDEVINLHPDDVVAKNGRAEVLKAQGRFADALAAFDEVISLHPDNVVAKTGRAEVLKAQGRFADALAAFDQVIGLHPDNRFARNGRSYVLLALHRYHEALDALPNTAPVDLEDWIAHHIRGMILLRLGQTVDSIKVFNDGLMHSPFLTTKEYFRGALALSWLRNGELKKAEETLDLLTLPTIQPAADVIRIHVFGAQNDRERAVKAYTNLKSTQYLLQDELTRELHHRYILENQPTKSEEWLFEKEVDMLLRAA